MAAIQQREHFVGLDGLRGIGALIIINGHMPDGTLLKYLGSGHLGVDFFFMLSGFVIAHAYLDKLEKGMGVIEFMRVRFVRLYPIYFAGTMMTAAFLLLLALRGWYDLDPFAFFATLGANLLYLPLPLPNPVHPDNVFPFNIPSWSLFWELASNLVLALLVAHLRGWRLALLVAVGFVLMCATAIAGGHLHQGWTWHNFLGGGGRVSYALFAGVALYRLWRQGLAPRVRLPFALLALFPLLVMCFPIIPGWRAFTDIAMVTFVLPVMVIVAAGAEPKGILRTFSIWSGRLSYGVYVFQMPVIIIVATAFHVVFDVKFSTLGLWGTLLMATTVLGVAWAADVWWDGPMRRWLRTATAPKPAPALRSAAAE